MWSGYFVAAYVAAALLDALYGLSYVLVNGWVKLIAILKYFILLMYFTAFWSNGLKMDDVGLYRRFYNSNKGIGMITLF